MAGQAEKSRKSCERSNGKNRAHLASKQVSWTSKSARSMIAGPGFVSPEGGSVMKPFVFLYLLMAISGVESVLNAATIQVPADQPTIQAGIDAATAGDIVLVAAGTYTGDGNRDISFAGKAITVCSEQGAQLTVVDCPYHRGFIFNHSEDRHAVLDGFTIINGSSESDGGGILCQDAIPVIANCIITHNSICADQAVYGGGIFCGGDALIYNCIIANNYILSTSNYSFGGGIYCRSTTMVNCMIFGNDAENWDNAAGVGGGVYCTGSILANCLVYGNAAGGDIYPTTHLSAGIASTASSLINCTIISNYSFHEGHDDGVGANNSVITNCIIRDTSGFYDRCIITYSDIIGNSGGEGNIDEEPLFVSGAEGDYYLSQTSAGQGQQSPCVDTGSQLSESLCFASPSGTICLNEETTRTDSVGDGGWVDMGFHYVSSAVTTPTANPTPLPTRTPYMTPSFTPTITLTPTRSPMPTATEIPLGVRLFMPARYFSPGQECELTAIVYVDQEAAPEFLLFVVLEVYGSFWYWNSWGQEVNYVTCQNLPVGKKLLPIIEPFIWPDTGQESLETLIFWSAMTDPAMTYVFGGDVGIGQWRFGYGPP